MTQDRNLVRVAGESLYRSYLLRLWQEAPGDVNRVVLQDVVGGETRGFPNLESLFAYLRAAHEHVEGGESGDSG